MHESLTRFETSSLVWIKMRSEFLLLFKERKRCSKEFINLHAWTSSRASMPRPAHLPHLETKVQLTTFLEF